MAHSSLLFLVSIIFQAFFSSEALVNSCTGNCECKEITGETGLHANCTLTDLKELKPFILRPLEVKALKIVLCSEVEIVPEGSFGNLTNLVNLNLSNNSIRVITDGAFSNLNYLQHLDLSANRITKWEANFTNGSRLLSLLYLDISSNPSFRLPTALLKLHKLKEIRGVTWNEPCANCMLLRNYTLQNENLNSESINITISELVKGKYEVGKKENCRVNELEVSKEVVECAKHGFFPQCLDTDTKCFANEIKVTPIHRCWDSSNKYLNIAFFISPIALILNLTVVIITLTTRPVRRNVPMFLSSNMAVSDFMLTVYTLILITSRQMLYTDFLLIMDDLCNVIGFVWLTCQIVSVKTSLILTVERFLAIIYCMEPTVRITRTLAVVFAALTWCLGVVVAILPLAKISVYNSNTYCIPIGSIKDIPHSYELSIGLSLWGMLVYFVTIPLYVKIFFSVKKTSRRAGIKRDSTVAKRIGILVLSNMFFFFLPIVIAFLWLTTNLKETMSPQSREILTGVVPMLLFNLNAFINPLLYAFRAEKFQKALKMRIETICLRKPRSASWSSSVTSRTTRKRNSTLEPTPRPPVITSEALHLAEIIGPNENTMPFSRI